MMPNSPSPSSADSSTTGKVRVHALTHLWSVEDGVSAAAFEASLERALAGALRQRAADRPDLILLGELTALPLAFGGGRGAAAREQTSLGHAFLHLAMAYRQTIAHVRRTFSKVAPARAALLALSDALWTPFLQVLPRLARRHGVYLAAGIPGADVRPSTAPEDISLFAPEGDKGPTRQQVLVPTAPEVYNRSILFAPDGRQLGEARKVNLTDMERSAAGGLDPSAAPLDGVAPIQTPFGPLGLLVCYDGFFPEVVGRLTAAGARLVLQPSANGQPWPAPAGGSGRWQPEEWEEAAATALAPADGIMPALVHVCAMTGGRLFDVPFDGQSAVARRGAVGDGAVPPAFCGLEPAAPERMGRPWQFLQVTPRRPAVGERAPQQAEPGGALGDDRQPAASAGVELREDYRDDGPQAAGLWMDLDLSWSEPVQAAGARHGSYLLYPPG